MKYNRWEVLDWIQWGGIVAGLLGAACALAPLTVEENSATFYLFETCSLVLGIISLRLSFLLIKWKCPRCAKPFFRGAALLLCSRANYLWAQLKNVSTAA